MIRSQKYVVCNGITIYSNMIFINFVDGEEYNIART
jgi:hypothetical protein